MSRSSSYSIRIRNSLNSTGKNKKIQSRFLYYKSLCLLCLATGLQSWLKAISTWVRLLLENWVFNALLVSRVYLFSLFGSQESLVRYPTRIFEFSARNSNTRSILRYISVITGFWTSVDQKRCASLHFLICSPQRQPFFPHLIRFISSNPLPYFVKRTHSVSITFSIILTHIIKN